MRHDETTFTVETLADDETGATFIDDACYTWQRFDPTHDVMAFYGIRHDDYCVLCGAQINAGWVCLDAGTVVCTCHVITPETTPA